MTDLYRVLFDPAFMPHGHCYLWTPTMVWLQAGTNLLIGLAYLVISAFLWRLVRRVRDLPFQAVYLAFGVFIVTCGFTHFFDVLTIWHPLYWADAGVRVVTAIASVGTAVMLIPLLPQAEGLADAARFAHARGVQLQQLNRELESLYARTRETLADAIPQLVFTARPDGSVEFLNERWVAFTGVRDQHLGWGWTAALHPDDQEEGLRRWRRSLATGESFEMESRLLSADGSSRWFLLRALPIRESADGSPIIRWFASGTDIDEHRRAATERERLVTDLQDAAHTREVFLAVAAHELRTPVTPLRLQIETLLRAARAGQLDRMPPERLEAKLAMALRQTQRLGNLIDRLLDVTRLAGGGLEMELTEFDLVASVREIVEGHAAEVAALDVELKLDAPAELTVVSDRGRAEQMVESLLSNAIKFSAGKPVDVAIREQGGNVVIEVRDRGPGISADVQKRLFQRFERAAPAQQYPGLGLGLWLVREIAAALGGTATVQSEVGQGATFRIELPRLPITVGGGS